ncbi:MAG: glycosyltransferase [SAR324 cluster bacterium]|nr:glycosyltransferase [SAR324 cluster bacterium]
MTKKVLCLFPFTQSDLHPRNLKSLESIDGISPIRWDSRSFGIPWANKLSDHTKIFFLTNYLRITRRIRPITQFEFRCRSELVMLACRFYKPDIVFTTGRDAWMDGDLLKRMRQMGIVTMHLALDNYAHFEDFTVKMAPLYDYFFHFDSRPIEDLKQMGLKNVYHSPQGCYEYFSSKDIMVTEKNRKRFTCEVGFAGTLHPEREELLSHLTDFNLKIFGGSTWSKTKVRKFYQNSYLKNNSELLQFYSVADIIVNPHDITTGNGINYRFWEVACAGGFQLTTPQNEILENFEVGCDKDIDVYYDMTDLKQKIKFYLEHEDIRRRMSKRLTAKVLKNHGQMKYFNKMFEIVLNNNIVNNLK